MKGQIHNPLLGGETVLDGATEYTPVDFENLLTDNTLPIKKEVDEIIKNVIDDFSNEELTEIITKFGTENPELLSIIKNTEVFHKYIHSHERDEKYKYLISNLEKLHNFPNIFNILNETGFLYLAIIHEFGLNQCIFTLNDENIGQDKEAIIEDLKSLKSNSGPEIFYALKKYSDERFKQKMDIMENQRNILIQDFSQKSGLEIKRIGTGGDFFGKQVLNIELVNGKKAIIDKNTGEHLQYKIAGTKDIITSVYGTVLYGEYKMQMVRINSGDNNEQRFIILNKLNNNNIVEAFHVNGTNDYIIASRGQGEIYAIKTEQGPRIKVKKYLLNNGTEVHLDNDGHGKVKLYYINYSDDDNTTKKQIIEEISYLEIHTKEQLNNLDSENLKKVVKIPDGKGFFEYILKIKINGKWQFISLEEIDKSVRVELA